MVKSTSALVCIAALGVSGCSATPETAYPQAMSLTECYDYGVLEQRNRRRSAGGAVNVSSGASLAGSVIGLVIGTAIANDANRNRMELCAARFGGTPADIDAITAARRAGRETPVVASTSTTADRTSPGVQSRRAVPLPQVGCEYGAGVLQGGASYCVGY
ncbi:MAG: hypothetical protein AAFY38_08440 [Pseudomonadota bacterium]